MAVSAVAGWLVAVAAACLWGSCSVSVASALSAAGRGLVGRRVCSALGRSRSPAGCLLCLGSVLGGVSRRLLGDAVKCGLVELVDVPWRYALAQGLDEVAGLGLGLEEYLEGLGDSVDLGSVWIWDCAPSGSQGHGAASAPL